MRILVVEDEADLLTVVAKTLREEGFAVDTAVDGTEGLYKAAQWDYDAVVLDLMLPGIDGLELLERLRLVKKTPVLAVTALDKISDRVRGLDAGADDYIVKPFDLRELVARLRAVIRRNSNYARSVIEIGDVLLDTGSRTVTLRKAEVSLTAREYALVEYLMLKRGEVVTRSTLYEHVFDENDDSLSNVLDVHISNIRRKLGPDFITTRRGHGYTVMGGTDSGIEP